MFRPGDCELATGYLNTRRFFSRAIQYQCRISWFEHLCNFYSPHSTLSDIAMSFISTLLIGFLFVCLVGSSAPLAYPGSSDNALYSFAYHVLDPIAGQDFGHAEQGLQEAVKGEYQVLMPDDRIQVVTYTADHNGYMANVHYTDGSQSPAYGKQRSNQPASSSNYFSPPTGTPGYGANNYGSTYKGAQYTNGYLSGYASHGGSFLTNYAQPRMGAYVPGVGCTCP